MGEMMDRGANTVRGGVGGALKGALLGLGIAALLGTGFGILMGALLLPALGITAVFGASVAGIGVLSGIGVGLVSAITLGGLGAKVGGGIGAVAGGLRNPVQQPPSAGMGQEMSGQAMAPQQPYPSYMGVASAQEINAGYASQQGQGAGYAQGMAPQGYAQPAPYYGNQGQVPPAQQQQPYPGGYTEQVRSQQGVPAGARR